MNKHQPYHPIIYIRGFAATTDEIEETVADPYMGFNIGSSKSRQLWNGKIQKFFFESPMVRLKDEIVWPNKATHQLTTAVLSDGKGVSVSIPVNTASGIRPGIAATLRIEIRLWNQEDR
jgi:hypothetical protein